jgi:hypothetical protein
MGFVKAILVITLPENTVQWLPVVAYSTFFWPENEILETISPRVYDFLSKHILCVFAV